MQILFLFVLVFSSQLCGQALQLDDFAVCFNDSQTESVGIGKPCETTSPECKQESKEPFLFSELKTQLQKRLVGAPVAESRRWFYLAIHMNSKEWNEEKTWSKIDEQLKKLALKGNEGLVIETIQVKDFLGDKQLKLIRPKLNKIMKMFEMKGYRNTYYPRAGQWKKLLDLRAGIDKPEVEVITGDGQITVNPVCTPLSRFLTQGASIWIEIPLAKETKGEFLTANMKQQIETTARSTKDRKTMLFNFGTVEASKGWESRIKRELNLYARSIGFANSSFKHSPGKVRRKESLALVGNKAPDFELIDLSTQRKVRLSELLSSKLTILTFWGNT